MTLTFTRDAGGQRLADGTAHRYLISRAERGYLLQVWSAKEVHGLRLRGRLLHSDKHDTLALATGVARAFEALGEDFDSAAAGHRRRYTVAVDRAYYPGRATAAEH